MREGSPPRSYEDAESTRLSSFWHPPGSGQCTLPIKNDIGKSTLDIGEIETKSAQKV